MHWSLLQFPLHVVFSFLAATVQLVFAILFWGLSRDATARSLQWLAAASFTGCVYGICNAATTMPFDEDARRMVLQVGLEAGALHSSAWLAFMVADEKRKLYRIEKVLLSVGVLMVLLIPFPGVVIERQLLVRQVDWLPRTYADLKPTVFGAFCFATMCGSLLYLVIRNYLSNRRGVPNAKFRAAAAWVLFLVAVNDVFASMALVAMPLLLEAGFFVVIAVSGFLLVRNFVENARALSVANRLLAEAQSELVKRERLAALGQFSAIIAHEVRNPLGVFFNATSQLKKMVTKANGLDLVEVIYEESERLNRMVVDLLVFAKPPSPQYEAASALEIADGAMVAATSAMPSPPPILIRCGLQNDTIICDPTLLRQAIVNLLLNAIYVTTRVRNIEIVIDRRADHFRFEVIDDGPGVDEAMKEEIFSPFFTTRAQGTGLGLAVVRQVVDAHGGKVVVEKAPLGGAVFRMELPLRPPSDSSWRDVF